jgi:hypothetical protein
MLREQIGAQLRGHHSASVALNVTHPSMVPASAIGVKQ